MHTPRKVQFDIGWFCEVGQSPFLFFSNLGKGSPSHQTRLIKNKLDYSDCAPNVLLRCVPQKSNIGKFRIRKIITSAATCPSHACYSKQWQTCKGCVYDSIERCHRGGFALPQTYKQVLAVSRCYWCPFCIKQSVEAGSFHAPTALKLFRSCLKHRELFMCKECPCGLPWAACLRCMDEEVDPRAGSSFCSVCRKRHGPARGRSCCCGHAEAAPLTVDCSSPDSRPELAPLDADDGLLASVVDWDAVPA